MAALIDREPEAGSPAPQPWAYQQPVAEVLAALGGDSEIGLASAEAQARMARYGPNELQAEQPIPGWRKFLAQFQDVLVILLLIATAVSVGLWFYERDSALPYEGIAIFTIVVLNAVLGYIQEARAEQAVAALRAMSAAAAHVIRDGRRQEIPVAAVVPGDLIVVEAGDTIPADARLIQATALQTAEAALTGESLPTHKDAAPIEGAVGLGDRRNMLFSGTAVSYGRGRAVVTATGMQTELGTIAGLLRRTTNEATPLQEQLDRTGKLLGVLVLIIVAIVVATILLVEGITELSDVVDVLILGVALAVAAVPEGLPAIITAVLAIGVQRMARRNAIVRKLPAVETLGSASVIASDKTGTMTRNEMTVRTLITASGRVDLGDASDAERALPPDGSLLQAEMTRTLRAAALANDAVLQEHDGRWTFLGDPTEGALVVAARRVGLTDAELSDRFARVGELPFSSERKRMSVVLSDAAKPERLMVCIKGAPDVLIPRCSHELIGDAPQPLTPERLAAIHAGVEQMAGESLRTLGVAFRSIQPDALTPGADPDDGVEDGLVFLGLVGMLDPPRGEVRDAIQRAKGAGIRTVMITGDHPETARAIAAELGMDLAQRAISGAELEAMDDRQIEEAVRTSSVYARVDPEQKLRIVQALQRNGAIVAMTGDGVNDAPALKTADIGVAMGVTGTDVSKEAADMVLTDDNFASIVAAVEQGRTIYANIQKFLRFLLSSNIGEVLTMFLGVVLADLIGLRGQAAEGSAVILPLLAAQILWINLVTDGPPALALGLDPADADVMRHPPRAQHAGVITGQMWAGIGIVSVIMAVGTLGVLDASLPGGLIANDGGSLPYARTMAFTTLILFQLFNVLNARSDTRSAFSGLFQNAWLWGALALSVSLQLLVIYAPFLQVAFATVPLSLSDWVLVVCVASSVLWLREIGKLLHRWVS
jgi:P-type Ca2+ transporter type 2C